MTRVVFLLVALLAASSSLVGGSARAHGPHHAASADAVDRVAAPVGAHAPAAAFAVQRGGVAAMARGSHCPAEDGVPCACGVDRCTNPHPPQIALTGTGTARFSRSPVLHGPRLARCALAAVRRSPPGSVGSRAPPASS